MGSRPPETPGSLYTTGSAGGGVFRVLVGVPSTQVCEMMLIPLARTPRMKRRREETHSALGKKQGLASDSSQRGYPVRFSLLHRGSHLPHPDGE